MTPPNLHNDVYSDIRNLVRRDRNHRLMACGYALNETRYPARLRPKYLDIVNQEYPYPYCYSGCDSEARGMVYPVLFARIGSHNHIHKGDCDRRTSANRYRRYCKFEGVIPLPSRC